MVPAPAHWSDCDAALLRLLQLLRERGYAFVTPTPRTHATVLTRFGDTVGTGLEDVLGWSRPFRDGALDPRIVDLLDEAGVLERTGDRRRATVRVSALGGHLYLHSAFPTSAQDAVFFGPDSYRFERLIAATLSAGGGEGMTIVDIGTGAGVGAIVAGALRPGATIVATDLNPEALRLTRINAAAAGIGLGTHCGDMFAGYAGPIDVALANPPYILDADARLYRDGGGLHGGAVSIRMTGAILPRLAPGGRFILYTGAAMVGGEDRLRAALIPLGEANRCTLDYGELDPDVFGDELENPAYADVDRIAVVAALFRKAS